MILMIDNFDSFTYNLVQYFFMLGKEVVVRRNNEISVEDAMAMEPEFIVISPGPGRPDSAGVTIDLIREAAGKVPILGVCLGHQAIGHAFGGDIIKASRIMHGKTSDITHDSQGLFAGLASPLKAVRYHSLAIKEETMPECLLITARSEDGEIMGVRHKEFLIEGIQYHPESILTSTGKRQLSNFIKEVEGKKGGKR